MARPVALPTLILLGSAGLLAEALLKGISYGVSPGIQQLPKNDDFFSDEAARQWSKDGRGDLAIIEALGANAVRLYGNDPRQNHSNFLDEAHERNLKVMPGNSDWPFMQSPDNCMVNSDYDCSAQVKASYAMNLRHGFLQPDGAYHPAIGCIIVMNEPDLKLPDVYSPTTFSRGLISAIDGMLDAEDDAGVEATVRPLPNFTITMSFSLCGGCQHHADKPALGQMWHLRDAMLHPSKYGYEPRHDLAEVYRTRFVFSFNTANPSFHIEPLFLDHYTPEFPATPVFIGEYHWTNPRGDQAKDVKNALAISERHPLLLGISFFEMQLRTDLGGHIGFGLLRQGPRAIQRMTYVWDEFDIKCLIPVLDLNGQSVAAQVAEAYGGKVEYFEPDVCLR